MEQSIKYLLNAGWIPTKQGWLSPYDEAQHVRWSLEDAVEIERSFHEGE